MRSRTEAAALHTVLREARTLTEDYERALVHLLGHPPQEGAATGGGLGFDEYLRFRQGSLGSLLGYVQSYLNGVRNCEATASGQGLAFDYIAESGGLLNGKFYDYAVHEWAYVEHEPAIYALIVAYQKLYSHLSQEIKQLAV